ncbi:MAG TPA: hypothetical protein VFY79_07900 [Dehalococcoidia bacterium]|nr:hypothetical protein [Dehalococcoidia bacterium]
MRALVAVPDLLFQSRIDGALRALGIAWDAVGPGADAGGGEREAGLLVVDLQAEGVDAPALVRGAKARGGVVLAFGRHTDAAALRAARDAGADIVVARSQLAEELPELLDRLLAAAGWTGAGGARGGVDEN